MTSRPKAAAKKATTSGAGWLSVANPSVKIDEPASMNEWPKDPFPVLQMMRAKPTSPADNQMPRRSSITMGSRLVSR